MTKPSAVRSIPLDKLVLSPGNVRKTPPTLAAEAELKASIQSRGLKQNLVVHPSPDEKGIHAVTAGGRRLKALQELAAEGVIAADFKVPCLVEAEGEALETSLMENTIRAAMHPADEFVAMAGLIEAGASIEAVAARFGVPQRHVSQRLRLGKLAPELLDAYRESDLSFEVMTAFTLGADHAAQLAVWRQVKDQSYIQPYAVKRLLTQSAVAADSDLGTFVGVAAYEAAGGTVTRDLFTGDEDGFMDDAALVRRLAIEKLEARAADLRPSWAWTKAVLDPEYGFEAQYGHVRPQPAELPPEIASELERIEQRLAELEQTDEDEMTDELMAEAEQLEQRHDELAATAEGLAVYADKDRARAGCIVTVGDDGEFLLHEGLVERTATRNGAGAHATDTGDDGDDEFASASSEDDETSALSPTGEQAVRKECGFSQVLVDDLKAHRLLITKAHLAGDFAVAFDLALYSLAVDMFHRGYRSRPLDLKANETRPKSSLNDLAGTAAHDLLEAHRSGIDLDWLSLPPAQGFQALSALPPTAKQRLFAWCVASCLNAQLAVEDRADPVVECAGARLAIPFADYWRPTAANYWSRVKKAHSLATARAILGDRWARDHEGDKKAPLAAALEKAFDPVANAALIGLDRAARDGAGAWLPPGIAYGETAADADPADSSRPSHKAAALDPAADVAMDPSEAEHGDAASSDLPAFLTEDGPNHAGLNGAASV